MIRLSRFDLHFPPVERASPEGLLAIGGDLRPERLLEAYGIFPWYNDDQPHPLVVARSPQPGASNAAAGTPTRSDTSISCETPPPLAIDGIFAITT